MYILEVDVHTWKLMYILEVLVNNIEKNVDINIEKSEKLE